MKKRRLMLRVGFLVVIALASLVAVSLTSPKHKINQESVKFIQRGMTKAEVEAILGRPPGDYSKSPGGTWIQQPDDEVAPSTLQGARETWKSDDVMITVIFNPTVVAKPQVYLRRKSP
jgi:hypothetical protein